MRLKRQVWIFQESKFSSKKDRNLEIMPRRGRAASPVAARPPARHAAPPPPPPPRPAPSQVPAHAPAQVKML